MDRDCEVDVSGWIRVLVEYGWGWFVGVFRFPRLL